MLKKLTDYVYCFPHSEETDRPVLGLICGEKYSFIVDAGIFLRMHHHFRRSGKNGRPSNPKEKAITHWHWDHTFGIHAQ